MKLHLIIDTIFNLLSFVGLGVLWYYHTRLLNERIDKLQEEVDLLKPENN